MQTKQILLLQRSVLLKMRGFSLLEIAIVLVIVGLVMAASLKAGVTYMSMEKRRVTIARLDALDMAFVNFVSRNKRLPCPADGAIPSGAANAGIEQRNAANGVCSTMNRGVVPWVALGIPESEAQDGWFNRITYRVRSATAAIPNTGFTSNESLDMTSCDPAGSAVRVNRVINIHNVSTCVQNTPGVCDLPNVTGCTSVFNFLNARGIEIRDGTPGNILMDPAAGNGAAYVLISHGDNGAGAYSVSGVIQVAKGVAASPLETQNRNNLALQTYYTDAQQNIGVAGATHFDDILTYPSLHSVINKAQLGARPRLQ
jgi:prepilin-type N-terminal cleavage/methylation domain-containing protein